MKIIYPNVSNFDFDTSGLEKLMKNEIIIRFEIKINIFVK